MNHIFVDYENVHKVDLAIIGSKAVSFMLLMGPRQTKLDVSLVEKLLEHAASVQLVRLTASGKNALDFALAYYVGRAVVADPIGHFHIVSKDAGYDPLIEHLKGKGISAHRHDSFATLPFAAPVKPSAAVPRVKSSAKPKIHNPIPNEQEMQVLEHFRNPKATRPRSQKRLVSFLVTYFGRKITETEALGIVEKLQRTGHLAIGENGAVTYTIK